MPRHEQALVHAADGYTRSTGKVGVCLVTSGPGATIIEFIIEKEANVLPIVPGGNALYEMIMDY